MNGDDFPNLFFAIWLRVWTNEPGSVVMKFTLIFSWSIFEAEDSLIGYLAIMVNNGEQWWWMVDNGD